MPDVPDGFSDVFFYHPRPSDTWLLAIGEIEKEQHYSFTTLIYEKEKGSLWRVGIL
jgi:hypothetical protein